MSFKPSVERDLRRLPRDVIRRVLVVAERLSENPFPRQAAKLSGAERLYRIRVGDYRIIYEVDTSAKAVTVHYVRHRKAAYG
ncbi:MAG: type II toxin-antitoxin system RelE/ParE family toxin [Euryarchaeota archaeon]|nr:type II toxin-antitoxin system RelE/ParE family toxin [Euryarchaeota archaeon]